MSKQIESNPSRVAFDPRDVDIEVLDEIAEERGTSRAELIREALKDVVEAHDTGADPAADLHKPDNAELREAFEKLLNASDHPHGPRLLSVEEAKAKLHTQDCAKAEVKRRLLKPLEKDGFIAVNNGRISVRRRTVGQVEAAEATADKALADLEAAVSEGPDYRDVSERQQELLKYQRAGLDVPFRLAAWSAINTLWNDDRRASA